MKLSFFAWLGVGLAGCAGSIDSLPVAFDPVCIACDHPACDTSLELQYLGSGGFLLQRGADEIATGPFFSNPGVLAAGLFSLETDVDAVQEFMPDRPHLSAILVGHAHYDHLMDIPTVVRLKAPTATIYASESAANSLASIDPPLLFETVDSRGWSPGQTQDWISIPGTRIRILAIKSEHAPHFFGITMMQGSFDQPLAALPKRGSDWLEGQSHSFLIEFLDANGQPEFRVHYQDSATNGGVGMPPSELDAGVAQAPYVIMLPTVASWSQVSNYPEALVERLQPDYAVLGHWEDFFRPFTSERESLRSVRMTDPEPFIEKLKSSMGESAFVLPAPLTPIRFARQCS
jgi:L-ascorbate metabolism protein UlaG (beta-lactamase superfamily)